jgi:hypothetical protein
MSTLHRRSSSLNKDRRFPRGFIAFCRKMNDMKWIVCFACLLLVCITAASAQNLQVKVIDRRDSDFALRLPDGV